MKWKKLIWSVQSEPDLSEHFGEGASYAEIQETEKALGVILPTEVKAFYREINGYGQKRPGGVLWEIYPLELLAQKKAEVDEWILSRHPDWTKEEMCRFYTLSNPWNNGDYLGLFLDENRKFKEGIYGFYHENLKSKEPQLLDDFIVKINDSFEEAIREHHSY